MGREAELGALFAAWDRAQDGEGGFCAIVGEPGTGKTRLVRELLRRADHYVSATAAGALPYAGFVGFLELGVRQTGLVQLRPEQVGFVQLRP